MKILIIHGPNLNMLGERNHSIYGKDSLETINNLIEQRASSLDIDVDFFQSNHEGFIVDRIQDLVKSDYDGLIINPAGFTHYSIVIRDAIEVLKIPVIEVHLSNIYQREDFRTKSVIAPVCTGQISGLGKAGYIVAIDAIKLMIKQNLGG